MTGSLLLHSRRAQTEALSEALDSLATADDDPRGLSLEVRWLMEDCVRTSGRLKTAFDDGQRRWPATPVEDIHAFYAEFLAVVDRQLQLAGRVRERAATASEAFDLKPLDESIQTLSTLREEVAGLCEWLIAPEPRSDEPLPTPEETRAAYERGEYEYAEDILNRLLQGGPLVKE